MDVKELLQNQDLLEYASAALTTLVLGGSFSIYKKIKILEKIDVFDKTDLEYLKSLKHSMDRINNALDKIEQLNVNHEVRSATFESQISSLRYESKSLQERIQNLEREIARKL